MHDNPDLWDVVLEESEDGPVVSKWLRQGVDIFDFFQPFKGKYRGREFDSTVPPQMYFANAPSCRDFVPFINETLTKRLIEGSVELLGKTSEVPPPRCVNALSIEPKKPRLVLSMKGPTLWCIRYAFQVGPLGRNR